MDTWETVVGLLERHFSAGRSVQHTLQGMPIGAFGHCVAKPGSCVFIDGGNGALLSTPSAAVHLVRVAALEYNGTRRLRTHRKEAVCIATRHAHGTTITWAGQQWPGFEITDTTMPVEACIDIARRVAERSFAAAFDALVVFDGDLESRNPVEEAALRSLTMPHCALAKTTTWLTDQGSSVPAVLLRHGPSSAWHYTINPRQGIVKLHVLSRRAYRLDVQGVTVQDAAAALAAHNDPSFPGYPYGLVEADLLARVTVREQAALTELLRTRMRGTGQEHAGALDAHSVLDAIAGNVSAR